jgi:hypothetical protein
MLERDEGFVRILRRVELHGLPRAQRRRIERRWRKERRRAVPSPSAVFRYLAAFVNAEEEARRGMGHAFIPAANTHLSGFSRVTQDMLAFAQRRRPQVVATLDQDATLAETAKRGALYCYKGEKAYQPLTTRWAEQGMIVRSQFRDGNVPAGFEQLRELQESLAMLPIGVVKALLRSDTAGYQRELLRYCAEGEDPRFGVIEFAIGVDVTWEFKKAVAELTDEDWQPLRRKLDGQLVPTDQEWAEVCFVPNWVGCKKSNPEYRFLAIREPLRQRELPGVEPSQHLFPTMEMGQERYKLFGVVTNRDLPGEELVHWHRARCGKGEEVHGVMKEDLAGGQLPSGRFGANAAWWGITILAYNLDALMKALALPDGWATKRLKAIRFGVIHLAGRVMLQARRLIIRVMGGPLAYDLMVGMRQRIAALAHEPPG